MFANASEHLALIKGKGWLGMGEIFRRILLIIFPFECIKLGYIHAQHDIAYFTSHDRIQREDIGGKKNEPYSFALLDFGFYALSGPHV